MRIVFKETFLNILNFSENLTKSQNFNHQKFLNVILNQSECIDNRSTKNVFFVENNKYTLSQFRLILLISLN